MYSISSSVLSCGNATTKSSNKSLLDFSIFKLFNIKIHPPKQIYTIEILWQILSFCWIKCNIASSTLGTPSLRACVGIFRNDLMNHLDSFTSFIGLANFFFSILTGAMLALENLDKNWKKLWLETNLMIVAFLEMIWWITRIVSLLFGPYNVFFSSY